MANVSKIEMLRLLINQRLTAAAEDIFRVFGRTIAEYEEEISRSKVEIDRQRRLLDLSRQPQISVQADCSGETRVRDPQRVQVPTARNPVFKLDSRGNVNLFYKDE